MRFANTPCRHGPTYKKYYYTAAQRPMIRTLAQPMLGTNPERHG
jgi:hypothetical protein